MLEAFIITVLMIIARARTTPDLSGVRLRLSRDTSPRTIFCIMREMLPMASFSAAALVSGVALFLGLLMPMSPDTLGGLIFLVAGLQTGMLSRASITTAERLIGAEDGIADASLRRGLMEELVIYPLIPFIVAIVITAGL